ncbi:ABC transporter substrate-binding protein [Lacrimispora sphenoides]|uniref:Ribose transport system substrate-binding protein n=1 Tax=Lacrimispora sphenoides JCM 1415 TaxID=1297793 RepID=A0ABY1C2N3_9FIRM|nr:ABC transporter substrate-binding protein [Lacrimispora sphenoides]SET57495.1 ribose transport system substrate-binding protein [[Clostridium] sphenoides JCM 1415]SUY49847.1 LacI family transcriptional regulator [Lacrimispora sphenoides]
MKKRALALMMTVMMAGTLTACGGNSTAKSAETTQAAATTAATTAAESEKPAKPEAKSGPYKVTVIIKATDSSYWQTVLLGAKAAAAESNGEIEVTTAGPASETGIDEQVTILENAISAKPDGIVIASISSEATVPAVEEAVAAGIPVVTVDNKLATNVYTQHLATDHYAAASTAAEKMVEQWKEAGVDPAGKKVAVISADSGSAVNQARCEGFADKVKELVPDITLIETQYCDNDIAKAQDAVDNLILANADLIGIFGDNNHMGDGIANSIAQNEKSGSIIAYAFDSDDTEIEAIKNGALTGIVVQDPYGMGYEGVLSVIASLKGKNVEHDVVAATTLVTKDNLDVPEVQKLLYPGK